MNVYAEVGQNLQEWGDGPCPEGWIEMIDTRPDGDNFWAYVASSNGTWVLSVDLLNAEAARKEVDWRAEQLPFALQTLTAIQFGETGIAGTEQQWKDYWLALRKWTDTNPDFPDSTKRPVEPN